MPPALRRQRRPQRGPANRISQVASKLTDILPAPTNANLQNNYFFTASGTTVLTPEVIRIDHSLSGKGDPYSFGCATGIPGLPTCIRYSQVPGQDLLSQTWRSGRFNPFKGGQNLVFNPARFADPNKFVGQTSGPTGYTFGDLPRVNSQVRQSAYLAEDVSLSKTTRVREGVDLEFRAEFFNLLNRHDFGGADTNPTNPGFGQIAGLGQEGPRSGQVRLVVTF